MSYQLASGLSATRAHATDPDMTFVWSATDTGKSLLVTVKYGGGTYTNNEVSAEVPWGSEESVPIGPGTDKEIKVIGKVAVMWGPKQAECRSYVVTFSGHLVRGYVNNIVSRNETGTETRKFLEPIIVYARLE